jgi:hypothetical protein
MLPPDLIADGGTKLAKIEPLAIGIQGSYQVGLIVLCSHMHTQATALQWSMLESEMNFM